MDEEVMAEYSPEAINAGLKTLIVGRKIKLYEEVDSTNDLVKDAARRGEPEGLVVLAEEQVKGRGRLGRTWTAPPGSSILCSILLRPRFSPDQGFYLTIAAALAIYRAVGRPTLDENSGCARRSTADVPVEAAWSPVVGRPSMSDQRTIVQPSCSIKWPNDVLVNGRKVSGILSESEFVGGEWAFAVVGFGINVNLNEKELEQLRTIAPQATSLDAEWGAEMNRTVLLARVLGEFEGIYLALQGGQFGPVYEEWVGALETVGREVTIDYGGGKVSGRALRVERDGSLVIRKNGGGEWRVLAGDVVS